jgi:tRNA(fMet)-specific endonuclease VapC
MDEALLDTDILSEVLKAKNPQVVAAANQYLAQHQRFTFSAITLYEVVRGFRANKAARALSKFLKVVDDSDVVPISIPCSCEPPTCGETLASQGILAMMPT